MYKTLNTVAVQIIGTDMPPIEFPDSNSTSGVGTAVLNQILAERDVEGYLMDDGDRINAIIPYHAIDYVAVLPTRSEVEDPVDDTLKNCSGGGDGGDTGTLTIIADVYLAGSRIDVSAALEGQYGPLTFELIENPVPDDVLSYVQIPEMDAGDSIEVPGLPLGMTVRYTDADGNDATATVPSTITLGERK